MWGMFKKVICVFLGVLMLICSIPALGSKADVIPIPSEFSKHGIIYRVEKKQRGNFGIVSVIGIDDEAVDEDLSNIVIPESVRKNQVTWEVRSISSFAFSGRTDLNTVVVSKGVEDIGIGAFYKCTGLTGIALPSTVTKIGTYAFSGCTSLKNMDISEENGFFSGRDGLILSKDGMTIISAPGVSGEYKVPKGIKTIGTAAFDSNSLLTGITFSNTVTKVEEAAFYNCKNLVNINLKKTEYIGKEAFYGCGLEKVRIPQSVTKISDNPFAFCDSLEEITVSKKNRKFKAVDNLLMNSSGKKLICATTAQNGTLIPPGVSTVGAYAFAGNKKIENITFSKNIKKINECAFMLCTSLKKVRFSSGKIEFEKSEGSEYGVFYNTNNDMVIEFPYSEDSFTSGSAEDVMKAHCPDGVLITNY